MYIKKLLLYCALIFCLVICVGVANIAAASQIDFVCKKVTVETGKVIVYGFFKNNTASVVKLEKVNISVQGKDAITNNKILLEKEGTFEGFNDSLAAGGEKYYNLTINDSSVKPLPYQLNYHVKSNILYRNIGTQAANIKNKVTVQTGKKQLGKFTAEYPLIYINNSDVQNKINTDIARYVYGFVNHVNEVGAIEDPISGRGLGMRYKIIHEDDDYLSIRLNRWYHNITPVYGLVYDKNTGDRIPMNKFINKNAEQINSEVFSGRALLLDQSCQSFKIGINAEDVYSKDKSIKRVSENYLLLGKGLVCLIYGKYELAPGYRGDPYIVFGANKNDTDLLEYIKNKLKW